MLNSKYITILTNTEILLLVVVTHVIISTARPAFLLD